MLLVSFLNHLEMSKNISKLISSIDPTIKTASSEDGPKSIQFFCLTKSDIHHLVSGLPTKRALGPIRARSNCESAD